MSPENWLRVTVIALVVILLSGIPNVAEWAMWVLLFLFFLWCAVVFLAMLLVPEEFINHWRAKIDEWRK